VPRGAWHPSGGQVCFVLRLAATGDLVAGAATRSWRSSGARLRAAAPFTSEAAEDRHMPRSAAAAHQSMLLTVRPCTALWRAISECLESMPTCWFVPPMLTRNFIALPRLARAPAGAAGRLVHDLGYSTSFCACQPIRVVRRPWNERVVASTPRQARCGSLKEGGNS
jgi:hypothetical protein